MNSISFEFNTKYGVFSDALILSDEELSSLSETDIEAMKQKRRDNWIAVIEAPHVDQPIDEQPVQE